MSLYKEGDENLPTSKEIGTNRLPVFDFYDAKFAELINAQNFNNTQNYDEISKIMFNLFCNNESPIFEYAHMKGLADFLITTIKTKQNLVYSSLYLLVGLCNDPAGKISLQIISDEDFIAFVENSLREYTEGSDPSLVYKIIELYGSIYYDCSEKKILFDHIIDFGLLESIISNFPDGTPQIVRMLAYLIKNRSECGDFLQAIEFVIPFLKDASSMSISSILNQIRQEVFKKREIIDQLLTTKFYDYICEIASRPSYTYEKSVDTLTYQILCENALACAELICVSLDCSENINLVLQIGGFIDYFLDIERQDDFIAFTCKICSIILPKASYLPQLLIDKSFIKMLPKWFINGSFNLKKYATDLLLSVFENTPENKAHIVFDKIISPEVAQEIVSMFDSEPKMIKICKYFIQAALFLQRQAVLDELRCDELYDAAQTLSDECDEENEQFETLQFILLAIFSQNDE